jgi:uncharacterized protein (TIGR02996 family)
MTADELALLQEIAERPEDPAPRRVYADWLEDDGDVERASAIRLAVEGWLAFGQEEPARLRKRKAALQKVLRGRPWIGPRVPAPARDRVRFQSWGGFPTDVRAAPGQPAADLRLLLADDSDFIRTPLPMTWDFGDLDPGPETDDLLRLLRDRRRSACVWHVNLSRWTREAARLVGLLPELRGFRLWLLGNSWRGGPLAALGRQARLTAIDLQDSGVTDDRLRTLAPLKGLRHLILRQPGGLTGEGFDALTGFTSLETLWVFDAPSLKAAAFRHFAGYENLRHLYLTGGEGADDASPAHLRRLTQLRHLQLPDTRITGTGLRHLAGCRSLKRLELRRAPLTDAGLRELPAFPELEHLDLGTAAGLIHPVLPALPALRSLVLSGPAITAPADLSPLPLPRLETLNLGDSPGLTDAWIAKLEGLPELRSLTLRGCASLTDAAVPLLARLGSLRTLDVMRCPGMSKSARAEIARLLPGCKVRGK